MAHGDFLGEDGKKIREAILDAVDDGVPIRRALAVALEQLNFGHMEASSITSTLREVRKEKRG